MPDPVLELSNAVESLRKEITENFPDKDKLKTIDDFLDKQEKINQEVLAVQKKAEQAEKDLNEKIHDMELELARSTPSQEKDYREGVEYKALEAFVKYGDLMPAEQKQLLRTDADTSGGFLAPAEMDNAITKKIEEVSNIRAIARVRTIGSKTLEVPIRNTIPAATYEGQADTGADSVSSYEKETLTPYRQTFTSPVTMDMLMDAAFAMEGEILSDGAEAFAKGEGLGFVSGTGVKEPEGFLTNLVVAAAARISETSSTLEADDLILLTGDLKTGYDPVYIFNRRTLAFLRTLKATTGVFLWQPGMNGPVANTINGFPYLIANDMPDIASDSLSVAFGDFRRGYTIIDRTGLSIVRDEFTLKKKAIIEFTMSRWNTGQVTLPEAIKLLKTKT